MGGTFRDAIFETKEYEYAQCEAKMEELGGRVRSILEAKGFKSVASDGWKAPTVIVSYMRDEQDKGIAGAFKAQGIQIATGVPLKVDEPWGEGPPPAFRIGLFGLDKLKDVEQTVARFEAAINEICK